MSRIGKQPITIPPAVTVSLADHVITVSGPKGTLTRPIDSRVSIQVADGTIQISVVHPEEKKERALWGTYASHIMNMIAGVNTPYVKKLILEGIGYKSEVKGASLVLALGFSHPINVSIPEGLKVTAEKNVITTSGIDKEVVGGFVANVRALKKPEPYKGKGMRYEGEVIKRKQGKKTV